MSRERCVSAASRQFWFPQFRDFQNKPNQQQDPYKEAQEEQERIIRHLLEKKNGARRGDDDDAAAAGARGDDRARDVAGDPAAPAARALHGGGAHGRGLERLPGARAAGQGDARRDRLPCFARKGKDRKVILWLLFLVRVFIWGATFAAASSVVDFSPVTATTGGFSFLYRWRDAITRSMSMIGALVVYCEVIEVLVLLYFADQEVPYQWRKRVLLWMLSCFIGVCEATGIMSFLARKLLILMSPLGLFGVLIAAMWISIQLPWYRAPEFVERIAAKYLHPQKHQKRPSMLYHSQSEVEVVTEVQRADSSGYGYYEDRDQDQYQQRQFT